MSQASASAISAIEAAGGSIVSVYYTDLALRSVIKPHKFPIPIRAPLPTPNIMRYYVKYENRGYLSPEVQLSQVKARLAAGMPAPLATSLHPVFVGGASLDADRHIIDIDVNAPKKVMEAAAQAGAAQPGAGAAKASA